LIPTFTLPVQTGVGIVVILEGPGGPVSDIAHFFSLNGLSTLQFYSDLPEPGELNPDMSDIGLPMINSQFPAFVLEDPVTGQALYEPAPFEGGSARYLFVSDVDIPEPSTFALLVSGLLLAGFGFRRAGNSSDSPRPQSR
jgi:hypothetical protein